VIYKSIKNKIIEKNKKITNKKRIKIKKRRGSSPDFGFAKICNEHGKILWILPYFIY